MAKLPFMQGPDFVGRVLRFLQNIRSLSVTEIQQEADRPFELALVGGIEATAALRARLGLENPGDLAADKPAPGVTNVKTYGAIGDVPAGSLVILADSIGTDEALLGQALARMSQDRRDHRLALARSVPAFRPAVVSQLIADMSLRNAKIALVSALPGIVPFTDLLLPAVSVGDILVLTRNQGILLLRIAAAYGKDVDMRARMRELLPIVGSAFGWRAIARELTGLVPGGIGVIVKASIAYAGTYTVGKAASIYYSTGQILPKSRLKQLYKDALKDAGNRVKTMLRRRGGGPGRYRASAAISTDPAAA